MSQDGRAAVRVGLGVGVRAGHQDLCWELGPDLWSGLARRSGLALCLGLGSEDRAESGLGLHLEPLVGFRGWDWGEEPSTEPGSRSRPELGPRAEHRSIWTQERREFCLNA